MRPSLVVFSSGLLVALAAGCADLPEPRPPVLLGAVTSGTDVRPSIAVLAPALALAQDDAPKGYLPEEVLDRAEAAGTLAAWLRQQGAFERVEVIPGDAASGEEAITAAWDRGLDLVLESEVEDLRVAFEGHNAWWIPNIINWCYWIVPSWFVATEEYALSFRGLLRVRSVATGATIFEAAAPVRVEGTFGEFDRGWQLLGFIYPNNDADNWRQIGRALAPAAVSELGAAAATSLGAPLRARLNDPAVRPALTKTLALIVGVSHYREAERLPPLAHAADDASAFAHALSAAAGLEPRHLDLRLGSEASLAGVEAGLARLRQRAGPGDRIVVYFAGYGTRTTAGPALLLHDSAAGGGGALELARLATLLGDAAQDALVVLDTGFDGLGRSVTGAPAPLNPADDLAPLARRACVLVAAAVGTSVLEPAHLDNGLFTHHVVAALGDPATDRDGDRRLGAAELLAVVEERTASDAAFFGGTQRPTGAGLARGFALDLRPGTRASSAATPETP